MLRLEGRSPCSHANFNRILKLPLSHQRFQSWLWLQTRGFQNMVKESRLPLWLITDWLDLIKVFLTSTKRRNLWLSGSAQGSHKTNETKQRLPSCTDAAVMRNHGPGSILMRPWTASPTQLCSQSILPGPRAFPIYTAKPASRFAARSKTKIQTVATRNRLNLRTNI